MAAQFIPLLGKAVAVGGQAVAAGSKFAGSLAPVVKAGASKVMPAAKTAAHKVGTFAGKLNRGGNAAQAAQAAQSASQQKFLPATVDVQARSMPPITEVIPDPWGGDDIRMPARPQTSTALVPARQPVATAPPVQPPVQPPAQPPQVDAVYPSGEAAANYPPGMFRRLRDGFASQFSPEAIGGTLSGGMLSTAMMAPMFMMTPGATSQQTVDELSQLMSPEEYEHLRQQLHARRQAQMEQM
jgi:hypothetical protein